MLLAVGHIGIRLFFVSLKQAFAFVQQIEGGRGQTSDRSSRIRQDPAFTFFPEEKRERGSLTDRQKSDPVKDTESQWEAEIHQFGLEAPGGEVEEKPRIWALSVALSASKGEVLGNN